MLLRPHSFGPIAEKVRQDLTQARERSLLYRPLLEVRFVSIDVETTGLAVNSDEIISYGAVAIEQGEIVWESCTHHLFDPKRPIPPFITRLTGISNATVQWQPAFIELLPQIVASLRRSVLLGHCLHFDLAFINKKLRELCRQPLPHYTVDLRDVARSLYPGLPSYSLDSILALFGLAGRYRRHSALGDALAAAEVFLLMLEKLAAKGIGTLAELNAFLSCQNHVFPA